MGLSGVGFDASFTSLAIDAGSSLLGGAGGSNVFDSLFSGGASGTSNLFGSGGGQQLLGALLSAIGDQVKQSDPQMGELLSKLGQALSGGQSGASSAGGTDASSGASGTSSTGGADAAGAGGLDKQTIGQLLEAIGKAVEKTNPELGQSLQKLGQEMKGTGGADAGSGSGSGSPASGGASPSASSGGSSPDGASASGDASGAGGASAAGSIDTKLLGTLLEVLGQALSKSDPQMGQALQELGKKLAGGQGATGAATA